MDWASAICSALTVLTPRCLMGGAVQSPDAQVDDVERLQAEVVEVVVHGLAQLLRGPGLRPTALLVP
jgi:hypothetical protein